AARPLKDGVENQIVDVVPHHRERGRNEAYHADIVHGHGKDQRAERDDEDEAEDLEQEGMTDAVPGCTHGSELLIQDLSPRALKAWGGVFGPSRTIPIVGEVVLVKGYLVPPR